MDIEYDNQLESNYMEYKKGLIANENAKNAIFEDPPIVYNPSSFQEDIIIKYFQNVGLINKEKYCPKCGDIMNICKRNYTIDIIAFRCHRRNPIHDIKINIRNGSIFENFQVKIKLFIF